MAKLQKMLVQGDYEVFTRTCIVDEITKGGEYTVCGMAIPDSRLDLEGFAANGKEFKGSIKDCTCQGCLDIVNYFKRLR